LRRCCQTSVPQVLLSGNGCGTVAWLTLGRRPELNAERPAALEIDNLPLCLAACSWVQEQLREHGGDLWISGAEDYARHARDLLQDFADVISQRSEEPAAAAESGAAAQVPVPTSGAVLAADARTRRRTVVLRALRMCS